MGTRAIAIITGTLNPGEFKSKHGHDSAVCLYRHMDGGANWWLRDIGRAITFLSDGEIVRQRIHEEVYFSTAVVKQAVLAHSMYSTHMCVEVTNEHVGKPHISTLKHAGGWDIEWAYVIDAVARNVNVYTVKNMDGIVQKSYASPEAHLATGGLMVRSDIEKVVQRDYRQDYWQEKTAEITRIYDDIEAAGWTICAKDDPYRRLIQTQEAKSAEKIATPDRHRAELAVA